MRHHRTWLWAVGGAAAVIVTGVLFQRSRSLDVGAHGAVVDAIGEVEFQAAELARDALAARFGLAKDYDQLVATSDALRRGVVALDAALTGADAATAPIRDAVMGLAAAVDAKQVVIERLKRETAVLKNSLRYLPLAAELLLRDTGTAVSPVAVNAVVQTTLVYDLLGEERLLERQRAAVAELRAARPAFPTAVRGDLDLLVRHAERVASHHAVVAPLLRRALERDLSDAVAEARGAYNARFEQRAGDAASWRLGLYAWCVLLLLGLAVVGFELRGLFRTLERRVAERTAALNERNAEMALVLDNVDQGLLTLDRAARVAGERSAILGAWLPALAPGRSFAEALAPTAPDAAEWFSLGWESVVDGLMPLELTLDQLPAKLRVAGRHLAVAYKPLLDGAGEWQRMLVVVTDVSAVVAREQCERRQAETLAVFMRLSRDRAGYLEFHAEADEMVRRLASGEAGDDHVDKRLLHTLKGNSAIFGLDSVARHVHGLEDALGEAGRGLLPAEREGLAAVWREVCDTLAPLLGDTDGVSVAIERHDVERLLLMIEADVSRGELASTVAGWRLEPTSRRLERMRDQAARLACRLGRDPLTVSIDDNGLRLDPREWVQVWQSLIHALRNAVDHGIEPSDERTAAGKSPAGGLRLATRLAGDELVIEVADDGRGIDWQRVIARAAERGLPHGSHDELVAALLSEGLTTMATRTEVSGRGVGMAALRDAVALRGGRVDVVTAPGQGTALRLVFPAGPGGVRVAVRSAVPLTQLPRTRRHGRARARA